ncbi:hypothetical protein ALO82_200189 [Pseudomonas syringae pv. broussonetiae]|nr:hypothetical protein ALO82_200189 [Pseudomonas syringae pv. broussonetiae]
MLTWLSHAWALAISASCSRALVVAVGRRPCTPSPATSMPAFFAYASTTIQIPLAETLAPVDEVAGLQLRCFFAAQPVVEQQGLHSPITQRYCAAIKA